MAITVGFYTHGYSVCVTKLGDSIEFEIEQVDLFRLNRPIDRRIFSKTTPISTIRQYISSITRHDVNMNLIESAIRKINLVGMAQFEVIGY